MPQPVQSDIDPAVSELLGLTNQLPTLLPASRAQLEKSTVAYNVARAAAPVSVQRTSEELAAIGKRPGFDLDVTSGVPKYMRWKLGFARDVPTSIAVLEEEYGKGNVEQARDGSLVVRNIRDAATGVVRDYRVNERGFSMGDVAELGGALPEVAGAVAGMVARKGLMKPPTEMLRRLADIAFGAVGAETAGGIKDFGTRLTYDQPVDVPEILAERGKMVLTDAAIDLGTAGMGSLIHKMPYRIMSPFGGERPELQRLGIESAERLKQQTGEGVTFTPGQATGSPMLQRTEKFAEKVGGSRAFIKMADDFKNSVNKIKQFMLGNRPLASELDIGNRAVEALDSALANARDNAATVSLASVQQASTDLLDEFSRATVATRALYKRPVGQAVRANVLGQLDAWKGQNRVNYAAVYNEPEGQLPVFPTKAIKDAADDIKAHLPTREQIVEDPTGLFDPTGKQITTVGTERVPLKRPFVPPNLTRMLDEAGKLDPEMKLNELVQMRNLLSDAIDEHEAMPGISTRYLKQFRASITQAIEDGKDKLGNAPIVKLLENANEFYKKGRSRFEQPGIPELLVSSKSPGYLYDSEIVDRVVGGKGSPELLATFKGFMGANSPEYNLLKRASLDKIASDSILIGKAEEGVVDGAKLVTKLRALDPEVLEELLGPRANSVFRTGTALGVFQGKIRLDEFEKIVQSGQDTQRRFSQAIAAQKKADQLYENNVVRSFVAGKTSPASISPGEFVGRFATVADPDDVAKAMSVLEAASPELAQDVRAKTLEHLFHQLDTSMTPDSLQKLERVLGPGKAMGLMDPKALKKTIFKDERTAKQYEAIIGPHMISMLGDLSNVLALQAEKEMVGSTVGGLGASSALSSLISDFDPRAAAKIVKYKLVAGILASPVARKYATQRLSRPDSTALSQMLIASEPLIEGMADELGDETRVTRILNIMYDSLHGDSETRPQPQQDQSGIDPQVKQLLRATP